MDGHKKTATIGCGEPLCWGYQPLLNSIADSYLALFGFGNESKTEFRKATPSLDSSLRRLAGVQHDVSFPQHTMQPAFDEYDHTVQALAPKALAPNGVEEGLEELVQSQPARHDFRASASRIQTLPTCLSQRRGRFQTTAEASLGYQSTVGSTINKRRRRS